MVMFMSIICCCSIIYLCLFSHKIYIKTLKKPCLNLQIISKNPQVLLIYFEREFYHNKINFLNQINFGIKALGFICSRKI